jgi:hypothetical protein
VRRSRACDDDYVAVTPWAWPSLNDPHISLLKPKHPNLSAPVPLVLQPPFRRVLLSYQSSDDTHSAQHPLLLLPFRTGLYKMPERKPLPNGILDTRLGVSSRQLVCSTCSNKLADCAGHFGATPIFGFALPVPSPPHPPSHLLRVMSVLAYLLRQATSSCSCLSSTSATSSTQSRCYSAFAKLARR